MSTEELFITIAADGTVEFIYNDTLASLLEEGESKVVRASHVEPAPGGGWNVDMGPRNGPILGPFRLHSEAIETELGYLRIDLASGIKTAPQNC